MANNNECALSQTSGYTSNSNSTNNFDLKEIGGIELDSGQYGVDLSGRLADINENFNKIIESDFLRGAPGRSIGISTWVFNNETKDTHIGQSLVDAIMSNNPYTPESDTLRSSIVGALMDKEIKVIYDEDGQIVSSLPFTFIDKRFYDGKTLDKSLANETDLTCVLVYETAKDSNGFVAAQTFPTLYWDASLDGGNFCWKINGQKTGLPCKGPQGNDGSGGTLYTVIYDPEVKNVSNGSSACEIVGVMGLNGTNVSDIKNEFIPKNQFKDRQIAIKTGDTVIAIPGSIDGGGNVLFTPYSNSSIGTTVASDVATYMYSITTAFVTNDDNYYVVISGDTIHIPYVLQGGSLANLMNMIGGDYMLGLYIPTEKSNGSITKGHTLWSDRVNSSNLCIGEVANPAEINKWSENPELVDDPSSVSLLYNKVSVGKDVDGTKAVTKITKGITDIVAMYPESSQYQTIEVNRFEKSYLIDNMFETSYGVIGREYDFYSTYNSREKSYFGIYQPVKIANDWRYAAQITSSTGQIFYILWGGLNDFISLLSKWYDCINQENGNSFPDLHKVQIVELNNLRVEDNDWVCDSYTSVNTSEIQWDVVYQNRHNLSIKRVICDNVYISGRNTMNFTYTGYDDDGITYELRSRILTVDKNEPCILPIDIYRGNDFQHCVPFVIARFTTFPIKVENVDVIPEGKNSFDVHATFNVYHQYYRPYYHGARLHEKYHQYEGDFDQYYKVNTKRFDVKAPDINVETTDINVEATNINVETTESHIKSAQHRVGHTRYINGSTNNLVSFNGVTIHPTIRRLGLTDDLGEILEYDLYIPLCAMIRGTIPGYASVYKLKPNGGTKIPACLILWSKLKVNIISFYKKYYKIQTSTDPIAVPVLKLIDFADLDITMCVSDIDEPYNQFVLDITHPIAGDEPFELVGAYPSYRDQKTFVREDVSIYTDRIEWVERDPHSNPHKRYTVNLSPSEIESEITTNGGAFIIAKEVSETRSQDPSKYVIIMCGHGRYLSYENLGEDYSYHSYLTDFKNIYKYDTDGQDKFNKVLIINRMPDAFPAIDSSCEAWQEKVCTRGSEIKNDCSEYSVYCHQFFVNGIDIVPLLPKLQELVSSSNS